MTLTARDSRLVIFREGLVKGVPGANHLAYEVEVSDGAVTGPETCDDGVNSDLYGTGCAPGCVAPARCGDGVVQAAFDEECDRGSGNQDGVYGGCTTQCKLGPYCGDGTVNRLAEECDGGDDTNCPGACNTLACTCSATCGNDTIEFGEQCDGTADAACPTLCNPPGGAAECQCPAICGDGFLANGEQCDPGGTPPGTPADDDACPGECQPGVCTCPVPICGDGVIEGTETCELPTIGCGPLQVCVACTQCAP